jgi:hypothetical protein
MKRYICIILVLATFSCTDLYAQWQVLAPNILMPWNNRNYKTNEFGAIAIKGSTIVAGWINMVVSIDRGKTWKKISSPVETAPLRFNYFDVIEDIDIFDDHTFAVVLLWEGAFITNDQGNSWQELPGSSVGCRSIIFDRAPDRLIMFSNISSPQTLVVSQTAILSSYTGAGQDIQISADSSYRKMSNNGSTSAMEASYDHGVSWQPISFPPPSDNYTFIADKCDPNRYVIVNEDWATRQTDTSHIFLTTDNGKRWTSVYSRPLGVFTDLNGNSVVGLNNYYIGSQSGILRSIDRGLTWKNIGGPITAVDSRSLGASGDSIVFAIDTVGSIWAMFNNSSDSLSIYNGNEPTLGTADESTDTIGGSVYIPIIIKNINKSLDVDLVIHYGSQLEYNGSFSPNGLSLDIKGQQSKGRSKLHIPGAMNEMIAGYAHFYVFPDSLQKPKVWFDSIDLPNTIMFCAHTLESSAVSIITPPSGCGVSMISDFMQNGKIPQIIIFPNPAENILSIESSMVIPNVHISVFDQIGNDRLDMVLSFTESEIRRIDVNALPSGIYLVRMEANGFVSHKALIVNH